MLEKTASWLEHLDRKRDAILFVPIKKAWPRAITPNFLTWVRIAISALLCFLLFYKGYDHAGVIIPLFLLGAITDMLDGSVARGLNMETTLGAILDPIADRLLIIPIALYSLLSSQAVLLALLIVLEIANFAASALTYRKHIAVSSNIFGKTKMVLQSVVFLAILIFWPHTPHVFFIWMLWASLALLVISIYMKIMNHGATTA